MAARQPPFLVYRYTIDSDWRPWVFGIGTELWLSRGAGSPTSGDDTILALIAEYDALPEVAVLTSLADQLLAELPTSAWLAGDGCCWPPLIVYKIIARRRLTS